MDSKERNTSLEFLSRTAFLRREMQGREADHSYLRDGVTAEDSSVTIPHRIIYIFDTNVVMSYCAPWIKGPLTTNGGNGAGVVIPASWASERNADNIRAELDENHATLLLKALAECALLRASDVKLQWAEQGQDIAQSPSRQPVLMFPAHFEETGNIYKVVAEKAKASGSSLDPRDVLDREARLAQSAIALLRSTKDGYDPNSSIPNRTLQLVSFLIRRQMQIRLKGPAREWDRYVQLSTRTGGLYSAADAEVFFDDDSEVKRAFQVLKGALGTDEAALREDLVRYWKRRLGSQKSRDHLERHTVDAQALADLFLINLRLKDAGTRVVLVTADENLARAAYGGVSLARASIEEPALRSFLLDGQSGFARDFSQRHVRHIWAFIEDALTGQEMKTDSSSQMSDFFNGLLAKGANTTSFPPEVTERIALYPGDHSDLAPSQERIDQTLGDWIAVSQSGALQSGLSDFSPTDKMRDSILEVIFSTTTEHLDWRDLNRLIQEKVDQEQDRLTTNLSDTGIAPLVRAKLLGARNPPDLNFSSFPSTQRIFDNLACGAYLKASEFELDFSKISLDCVTPIEHGLIDDRQISYLRYVVLGAAFASADKWSVALEHALMAAGIVRRAKLPVSPIPHIIEGDQRSKVITGREAHFLAAVAQRITAKTDLDFDLADHHLTKFDNAMQMDPSIETLGAKHLHLARLDSERLALALARYYLGRSLTSLPCHSLFAEVISRCNLILRHLPSSDGPSVVGKVALSAIATNVIQVAVIAEYRLGKEYSRTRECPEAFDQLRGCLMILQRLVKLPNAFLEDNDHTVNDARLACSSLMKAYFIAGALVANDEKQFPFLTMGSKLLEHFPLRQDSIVTIYDPWRYDHLEIFCKTRLGLEAPFEN